VFADGLHHLSEVAAAGAVCILVTLGVEQRTWHTIGMVPIRKPYALMWWAACALCLVAAGISLPGERPWLAYAPAAAPRKTPRLAGRRDGRERRQGATGTCRTQPKASAVSNAA